MLLVSMLRLVHLVESEEHGSHRVETDTHAEIVALLVSYGVDGNPGILVFGGSRTAEYTDSGTAVAPQEAEYTDSGTAVAPREAGYTDSGAAVAPREAEYTDSGTPEGIDSGIVGVSGSSRAAEKAHSGSLLSDSLPRCVSLK